MNYLKKFENLITLENPILRGSALSNCHTNGLHSFVLHKYPNDCLIRIFVATSDHDLWKNHCGMMSKTWDNLSIGIHPHHVDIAIYPIFGILWNVEFQKKRNRGSNPGDCHLKSFKWSSEILTGLGGFSLVGDEVLTLTNHRTMTQQRKYPMKSNELHTVYITKGQPAAWIIQESPASKGYDATTYSNVDLTSWSSDGLYLKPSEEDIVEIFKQIEIEL